MKKKLVIMLPFLLFFNSMSFSQSLKSGNESTSDDIVEKIDKLITPLVMTNNFAGTVLVIKDGKTIFSKSYGKMDFDNEIDNTINSKFLLASTSMMFTASAIMKLVDENKISLDDKLSKFFPDFKNGDKISIHYMLTERTGIPRIGNFAYHRITKHPQTPEKLISYFKDYDLLFEPGEKYNHGRNEYILLASIIEKVSGKSFGVYLKEEIFDPLGMKNTGHFSYDTKASDIVNLSKGWTEEGFIGLKRAPVLHWSAKTGHASIYSTAEDIGKFANAITNRELLSSKSWDAMLTDHYGDSFGYGLFISGSHQEGNIRYVMNGRSPGYTSHFAIYPDQQNMIVIMLGNIYNSLPYFVGPKLASLVSGEPYEKLNLTTRPISKEYAQNVIGTYQFGDFYRPNGSVKITLKEGILRSNGAAMIPVENEQGVITKFINRRYWSTLKFVPDTQGNIVALKYDNFLSKKKQ